MIIIPKKPSYDLPEGGYRAFLQDAFTIRDSATGKEAKSLRLVFQITSLSHPVSFIGQERTMISAMDRNWQMIWIRGSVMS
jgi:hypothetical protein